MAHEALGISGPRCLWSAISPQEVSPWISRHSSTRTAKRSPTRSSRPATLQARRQQPRPASPQAPAAGRAGRRRPSGGTLAAHATGHDRRRRDGHRQDLHRRSVGARGGVPTGVGALSPASRAKVAARGAGDGPRRRRCHRWVNHRLGGTPPLHGTAALRHRVARAGQALVPVEARHR